MLSGKTILVGVCGSIAAYKAVEVVDRLQRLGADVYVVMTKSATEFITPLTFQMNTNNMIVTSEQAEAPQMLLEIARRADCLLVVPASSNIIGKVACRITDSILSSVIPAARKAGVPVIFVPNTNIYANMLAKESMEQLVAEGCQMIEADDVSHVCGKGKIASVEEIIDAVTELLAYPKDMAGLNVLITAGTVGKPLEPLVYISNYSTGKLGYALAREAMHRGANVTLISGGHSSLHQIRGVNTIEVDTQSEMSETILQECEKQDIIIRSAKMERFSTGEKNNSQFDLLDEISSTTEGKVIGGFWLSLNAQAEAARQIAEKGLDFVVACDMSASPVEETNPVTILTKDGAKKSIEHLSNDEQAAEILNVAVAASKNRLLA